MRVNTQGDPVLVGHGVRLLSVPMGARMGGYVDRSHGSTGTLDELTVHVVTIGDDMQRFIWCVADVPCINRDLADVIKRTIAMKVPGVCPNTTWISATHTHSGPETGCMPGGATTPPRWRSGILSAALGAVYDALENEKRRALVLHRNTIYGVGGQRNEQGPNNDAVPVTIIEVRGGRRVAGVIVILPIHATVLGADNTLVSADLPGVIRAQLMSGAKSPPEWSIVATGAAGDISTRPHRRSQTPMELNRLGAVVASVIQGELDGVEVPIAGREIGIRSAEQADIRVPARSRCEATVSAAQLRRSLAAEPPGSAQYRAAYTRLQGAHLAGRARQVRDPKCAVSVLTLGELVFVGIGAEPFLGVQWELEERLGKSVVTVGYTNGYLGYLPTREAYSREDYEVLISPCGSGAAQAIIEYIVSLTV